MARTLPLVAYKQACKGYGKKPVMAGKEIFFLADPSAARLQAGLLVLDGPPHLEYFLLLEAVDSNPSMMKSQTAVS